MVHDFTGLPRRCGMPDCFQLKNSVVHERFGDETVIVNLDTGRYYSLPVVADAIWALAASGHSQQQVLEGVCAAFSGDPTEITTATADFLDQLVAEELLERVDRGVSSDAKPPAICGGQFVKPYLQKYTD